MVNRKIIFYIFIFLASLILIVITPNFSEIPSGHDYLSHIAATKGFVHDYKVMTLVRYPQALNIFIAILSLNIGIEPSTSFKIFHAFLLIGIVLAFSSLGRCLHERSILSLLIVLYFNFSMWAGIAFPYPATLCLLVIPLLINFLTRNEIKGLILTFFLLFVLYWYSIFLMLIFVLFYFLNKRRQYKPIILILVLIVVLRLSFFDGGFGNQYLDKVSDDLFKSYLETLFSFILITSFSILSIGNKKSSLALPGLSLLLTYLFIFIFLSRVLVIRSTFILLLASILLITAFIDYSKTHFLKKYTFCFISLFLIILILFVSINNISLLNTKAYTYEEKLAFEWVELNYGYGYQVLSDPITVKSSLSYGARGFYYSLSEKDLFGRPSFNEDVISLFNNSELSKENIVFFDFIKSDIAAGYKNIESTKPVIVVISKRTSYWQKYFTPRSAATYPREFIYFEGFDKFNNSAHFKEVYSKDSIFIFEYIKNETSV